MIKFVNAKINLGLRVLRKRPDGYHDLSTIFLPAGLHCGTPADPGSLCDVLEITPASHDEFLVTGSAPDCPPQKNLVWKALMAFREAGGDALPVKISLEKHLPGQAGMGGGSADAAFTLLSLNELAENPLPQQVLARIALSLGADVPFFLLNRPCLGGGVGEILTPIDIPQLRGKWLCVIKPEQGINTAQAFSLVTPSADVPDLAEAVKLPIIEWKQVITNDFEHSMFAIHPQLEALKQFLYGQGALYASMTGSGSAFYGIFPTEAAARTAAACAPTPFATFCRL